LQLLLTFLILSIITVIAILLMLLNKNSRSHKIRELALKNSWQYQEFINFSDPIKEANFAILNYSSNAIFRHTISANNDSYGLGFNFFDCRAIEAFGIHNSSIIMFNLALDIRFKTLHLSLLPQENATQQDALQSPINSNTLAKICQQQKLTKLKHYALQKHNAFSNNNTLSEMFLQSHHLTDNEEHPLSAWLLAHPHLHIEISNGMLLAYQPNRLLDDDSIIPAINAIADISILLSDVKHNTELNHDKNN